MSSSGSPPPSSAPPGPSSDPPTSDKPSTSTTETPTSEPVSTPSVPATTSTTPVSTEAPPPTVETPTSTSRRPNTSSVIVITSGNIEVTQTVVIQQSFATSNALPTQSSAPATSFFDNKGAVAGTFSAVGVVALVGIVFLVTLFIRRRRKEKFDREVDEAALEAATAPAPAFLDDEDDAYTQHTGVRSNYTGPSSNYYQSDSASHGTYSQPPLSGENYGMTEMNNLHRHGSIGPGQIFNTQDPYASAAAGAAGIGVTRTRSMAAPTQEKQGVGLAEGSTHYAAFAGPSPGQGQQQPHSHYGGEAYAVAGGLQRGPSNASFNPYGGTAEAVPPLPTGTPLQRSPSTGASLVNPYDQQPTPPMPPPPILTNPHSPNPGLERSGTTQIAGRVFSGGDFGGGSTPEFAHAPLHAAQTAEQGRWSDYHDDDNYSPADDAPRMPVHAHESDDEYEEERPKVFKVTN